MFAHRMACVFLHRTMPTYAYVNRISRVTSKILHRQSRASDSSCVGQNCTQINACASNPCLFGGTCLSGGNNSFICVCPINYSGVFCNQSVCTINPCKLCCAAAERLHSRHTSYRCKWGLSTVDEWLARIHVHMSTELWWTELQSVESVRDISVPE